MHLQQLQEPTNRLTRYKLLQIAMDSYYKLQQLFIAKCDTGLWQIAADIKKCDGLFTNCDST